MKRCHRQYVAVVAQVPSNCSTTLLSLSVCLFFCLFIFLGDSGLFGGPDHRSQSSHGGVRQRQNHPQRQLVSLRECKRGLVSLEASTPATRWRVMWSCVCVCVLQGKFIRIHFGTSGKLASADIEICESHNAIDFDVVVAVVLQYFPLVVFFFLANRFQDFWYKIFVSGKYDSCRNICLFS